MGVPMGAFMPDRAFVPGSDSPMHNINTVDLPVNIGIIKCGNEIHPRGFGLEADRISQDDAS